MVQKRIKLGQVGKAVLVTVALAGFVMTLAMLPGLTMAMAPFIKKKKYEPKQVIMRNVDALIRHGLLHRHTGKDGSVHLSLTKKGRWVALSRYGTFTKKKTAWDGKWRVIVFDIPVDKGSLRTEVRHAVKSFGFMLLQRSVWVYPYECDDFIKLLKEYLGVSHDLLYMKVSYLENDVHLRREFGVK